MKSFMSEFEYENKKGQKKAIVIEDQPVIWDYAQSCLEPYYQVVAFCGSTHEAEKALKEHKPDLVWLDCYLGELSELNQGVKNSGMQLASWIKSHYPQTAIFLFTASNEIAVFHTAQSLGIEGIALGGKFIRNKEIIRDGIKTVYYGANWISPSVIEDFELNNLGRITLFEFSVVSSMLLGKSSNQIAEELDTTRKQINNAIYRIKQKLFIDSDTSREDFLEIVKDKFIDSFEPSKYYNLSEIVSINTIIQETLTPVFDKIKSGDLTKMKLASGSSQ